ncbi:MAG: peptidylprolyl isomerase [Chloroflexota bacterium]
MRLRRLATIIALAGSVAACTSGAAATAKPAATQVPTPVPPATAVTDNTPAGCPTAQPDPLAATDVRTVTITTDKGDIAIKVQGSLSPIATGNFVALATCGWYTGVVFHRVVPGFVIQGGDGQYGRVPNVSKANVGTGGPAYTITDEPVTATYHRGTVAMARTSQPNSVGSQFFIVLDDGAQGSLASANTYQIIGEVTSGMEAADAIAAAADQEIPTNPVVMTKVTVTNP